MILLNQTNLSFSFVFVYKIYIYKITNITNLKPKVQLKVEDIIPDQDFGIIFRFNKKLRPAHLNYFQETSTDISRYFTDSLIKHWRPFIKTVFKSGKYQNIEFCINGTYGQTCYQSHFIPEFDPQNTVNSVIVISQDITKLKEINTRIDQFISMASHELKTPVTSLKIYSELISRSVECKKNSSLKLNINKMKKQVDKLNNIVDVFLDVARVKNDTVKLNFQKFSINKLILESIKFAKQSENSTHQYFYQPLKNNFIIADRRRIKAVIIGLLSNAVKYSPQNSKIIISTQKNKSSILVSIQDFGIGIDPKYQLKIFEKFYRIYNDFNQTFPGLGIGLYSASTVIKLHRGSLSVNSKLGQGSTFSFSLPQGPNR